MYYCSDTVGLWRRAVKILLIATTTACSPHRPPQRPPDPQKAATDEAQSIDARQPDTATVNIRAGRMIDGRGGVRDDVMISVTGHRIAAITPVSPSSPRPDYDLRRFVVMPGGIDTHVHIDWHFDADGGLHAPSAGDDSVEVLRFAGQNARATLYSGITTVQSLGSVFDPLLRNRIDRGEIEGPRVLTSVLQITQSAGSPAAVSLLANRAADMGANVIKLFGSSGLGGDEPDMTQAELNAGCAAARARGLRAAVHAMGDASIRRAVNAGCTSIEHGDGASDSTLALIAETRTFFDPNIWLVFANYISNNASHFGFPVASIELLRAAIPDMLDVFRRALKQPGMRIVFGTDAVAGAHGRNFEELIYRVRKGGQASMAAIESATSEAAASLGLSQVTGTLAPGMEADIIALRTDPLDRIEALRDVAFVMRAGRVYRRP